MVRLSKHLDRQTRSHIFVTTRIQGLLNASGAVEVPLGLLDAEDAARLLLTIAGADDCLPPYSPNALAAVEACGRLPLTLGVAAGILSEQFFTRVSDDFVSLLGEDHGEVLREGQHGDLFVSLEDRLITSSLKGYQGANPAFSPSQSTDRCARKSQRVLPPALPLRPPASKVRSGRR